MINKSLNVIKYFLRPHSVRCFCKPPKLMPYIAVRRVEGDERLQMSLSLSLDGKPSKTFNFDRLRDEKLGLTLQRMSANIQKKFAKKKKKSKAEDPASECSEITVELVNTSSGEKIDDDITNADAWVAGSKLRIREEEFDVAVNIPIIKSLEFPSSLMSGFPIFPKIETEFINKWDTQFIWLKSKRTSAGETDSEKSEEATTSSGYGRRGNSDENWTKVWEGSHYTPNNEDVGNSLKIVATPTVGGVSGEAVEVCSKETIDAGPGTCPFENRHLYTRKVADNDRVVSYNILADTYADSDFSRSQLYPYCPPYALAIDYRRQLLVKEIIGYNADIVCLQEVDRKVFNHELQPVMEAEGLDGRQHLKFGETPEGTVVFFRKSKFKVIEEHNITVAESLQNEQDNAELWEKIKSCEALRERVNRNTTLQVLVLESTVQPGKVVCIATTHLYFHPNANHVRLIQGAVCLKHLERIITQYREQGRDTSLVFCGDFNSSPHNGLIQYLERKAIASNDATWLSNGSEEHMGGMSLSHTLDLTSACGYPDYTNFVGGFQGCLDYIYIDKTKLDVVQVVPMPSHEEVTQYIALPNVVFPSDHIAIVCDVTWKS